MPKVLILSALKPTMYDYLIVGQGLAGSILAYLLKQQNKKVILIDHSDEPTASSISSGIINPVTGRNLVKSWIIDEVIAKADDFYTHLEGELNTKFYHKPIMHRTIKGIKELNDFTTKSGMEETIDYLGDTILSMDGEKYNANEGCFEIKQIRQLDIPLLCSTLKNYFSNENMLREERFDYSKLIETTIGYTYNDLNASVVIFCEGAGVRHNPYFNYLPFIIAKGELLHVHIPLLNQKNIVNNHKLLVPMNGDTYWFGATFNWNIKDDNTTDKGKRDLIEALDDLIKMDYTITEHLGAERPTIKDRRPVLGPHPQHKNLYIFNGLGTKGASLTPLFAEMMMGHLLHRETIRSEVDIARFN